MEKKWHLKRKYKLLILISVILITLILWSRYISTTGLLIKEYKIVNHNIPVSFDGLKIVQFSDVHYGRTINEKELTHLVNEINSLKPDLIFFTGDLIDKDIEITDKIKSEVVNSLNKLKASIGKYATSGNHDLKFKEYNKIITDSGFVNLNNNYDIIYSSSYETIYVAGLESEVKGHPNIKNITEYLNAKSTETGTKPNIPSYKILLLHTPDTIDKVADYKFDLALAGHSHNGQIRLPFIGSIATTEGAKKYHNPHYKINNTDLYISSGLGTSNINYRFFNKPSFNFYRLVKK